MLTQSLKQLANKTTRSMYFVSQIRQREEHVVIVGAGIVGVTTAIPFLEKGYKVTLIDREPQAATQTSHLNGCVFTPYNHKPMVSMTNMLQFFKSWFVPHSAYHLNLNIVREKNFWVWLINALILSMTKNCYDYNSHRTLDIGHESHEEFHRLKEKYPELFSTQSIYGNGQIGLYKDEKSLMSFKRILDEQNVPNEIITQLHQFKKFNPKLINPVNEKLMSKYYGCLYMPTETSLETSTFTKNAVEVLKKEFPDSFQARFNCEFESIMMANKKLATGIVTSTGEIHASRIVFATASHTRHTKQLNSRIPILPVRGFTAGIPYADLEFPENGGLPLALHFNIFNSEMFCVPVDGQLRLSGIAHLIKQNSNMDHWGCKQLIRQFNELYGMKIKETSCRFSRCYRPISPDDGAIVGRIEKFENIYINNGHGSKGTSHGFGAAKILFEIIDQGAEQKWHKFRLGRFYFV